MKLAKFVQPMLAGLVIFAVAIACGGQQVNKAGQLIDDVARYRAEAL